MDNNSFDSLNLDDYTLDVADFFCDYIINEGRFDKPNNLIRNREK